MIITYFDRKDDFKVKTRECYAVMPLVGNSEVLVKSKGLDPVFILTEDVIFISEEADNETDSMFNSMEKSLNDAIINVTGEEQ